MKKLAFIILIFLSLHTQMYGYIRGDKRVFCSNHGQQYSYKTCLWYFLDHYNGLYWSRVRSLWTGSCSSGGAYFNNMYKFDQSCNYPYPEMHDYYHAASNIAYRHWYTVLESNAFNRFYFVPDSSNAEINYIDFNYDAEDLTDNNRLLHFDSINGLLCLRSSSTQINQFKIIVWQADNDLDTVLNLSKILWSASAKLSVSNGLELSGGFSSNDFLFNNAGDSITAAIINKSYNFTIPEGVNMDNIVITVISDYSAVGLDTIQDYKNSVISQNIKKASWDFNVYPNPCSNLMPLSLLPDNSFVNYSEDNTPYSINLYSADGILILSRKVRNFQNGIDFDLSGILPGYYYMQISDNLGKYQYKSIIVQ